MSGVTCRLYLHASAIGVRPLMFNVTLFYLLNSLSYGLCSTPGLLHFYFYCAFFHFIFMMLSASDIFYFASLVTRRDVDLALLFILAYHVPLGNFTSHVGSFPP